MATIMQFVIGPRGSDFRALLLFGSLSSSGASEFMKTLSSAPRLLFMKVKQQSTNSGLQSAVVAVLINHVYDEENEYQVVRPDENFFDITLFELSPRVVKLEEGSAIISSNPTSGAYDAGFSIQFDNATLGSTGKLQFLSAIEQVHDSGTFMLEHFEIRAYMKK
jgi:hypothetical protein